MSCNRVLMSMNDTEEGRIIIGVRSHIVRNYLMNKIDRFRVRYPKIVIELIDLSTSALIEKLEERKVDFVIDSSPIECLYNNIEIKPICSLSTCFVKSKENNKKIKELALLQAELQHKVDLLSQNTSMPAGIKQDNLLLLTKNLLLIIVI